LGIQQAITPEGRSFNPPQFFSKQKTKKNFQNPQSGKPGFAQAIQALWNPTWQVQKTLGSFKHFGAGIQGSFPKQGLGKQTRNIGFFFWIKGASKIKPKFFPNSGSQRPFTARGFGPPHRPSLATSQYFLGQARHPFFCITLPFSG